MALVYPEFDYEGAPLVAPSATNLFNYKQKTAGTLLQGFDVEIGQARTQASVWSLWVNGATDAANDLTVPAGAVLASLTFSAAIALAVGDKVGLRLKTLTSGEIAAPVICFLHLNDPGAAGGAGSGLTVREIDGTPSGTASTLEFPNNQLTDQGNNVFRVTPLQGIQGLQGNAGVNGSNGTNGTNGTSGAPGSVWRAGVGTPVNTLGVNGDYYLNNSNGDVYQKISGTYGAPIANIKGPPGAAGDGTGGVVDSATVAGLPATGQAATIYLITSGADINKMYRWTGAAYALIGGAAAGSSGGGGTGGGTATPPRFFDDFTAAGIDLTKWAAPPAEFSISDNALVRTGSNYSGLETLNFIDFTDAECTVDFVVAPNNGGHQDIFFTFGGASPFYVELDGNNFLTLCDYFTGSNVITAQISRTSSGACTIRARKIGQRFLVDYRDAASTDWKILGVTNQIPSSIDLTQLKVKFVGGAYSNAVKWDNLVVRQYANSIVVDELSNNSLLASQTPNIAFGGADQSIAEGGAEVGNLFRTDATAGEIVYNVSNLKEIYLRGMNYPGSGNGYVPLYVKKYVAGVWTTLVLPSYEIDTATPSGWHNAYLHLSSGLNDATKLAVGIDGSLAWTPRIGLIVLIS